MSDVKVALVGAPRSGNRLIQGLLQRHGLVAEVRHYGMRKAFRNGGEWADYAVWPIRDVDCWRKSCLRDLAILPKPLGVLGLVENTLETVNELRRIHNERTLEYLATTGCPVLPVIYEELVAQPDVVGRAVLDFVHPDFEHFLGWGGVEVFDGNAKHKATT